MGFTIIFHPYKKFKATKNILSLWFITFAKGDLLANLEKGIKMYKELRQDYDIVQDLANNIQGNGHQKRSNEREG